LGGAALGSRRASYRESPDSYGQGGYVEPTAYGSPGSGGGGGGSRGGRNGAGSGGRSGTGPGGLYDRFGGGYGGSDFGGGAAASGGFADGGEVEYRSPYQRQDRY
jgi:hypothetical protein